jgi:hypothetical protein
MKIFNKNFTNYSIQQILINVYLSFMSLTIISLFIYFRLIIKRSSYSLEILKEIVGLEYFLLCFILLCLHIFIAFSIIYNSLYTPKNENKLIETVKYIIDLILWKPLMFLLDKSSPHIPYSGTFIIHYCYFFKQNDFTLFLMYLLNFIFYFAPKILMSTLFFIEILFYHQLKIFIQLFWILLLPIIYMIFLNLSEKFYDNNINPVKEPLFVTATGEPNQHGVYTAFIFTLKDKNAYSKEAFQEIVEMWNLLFYLKNLNKMIRIFISQLSPYVTLYTSSIYLIVLSYKIYYLFIL